MILKSEIFWQTNEARCEKKTAIVTGWKIILKSSGTSIEFVKTQQPWKVLNKLYILYLLGIATKPSNYISTHILHTWHSVHILLIALLIFTLIVVHPRASSIMIKSM